MSSSHLIAVRRAASALALVAAFHTLPAAAQNPPAPAPPPQPMAHDTAGHMMHMMAPGAGMGGAMNPMMGGMQGMRGMHGMRGMRGMAGMQGMQGMGPMAGPPDTAAVREHAEHLATFTRSYYEALMRKGFNAEQALRIVSGQGMPGPGAAR